MVQSYRDLTVWQKAMMLAEEIFHITESFPSSQKFVLVTQMQRSALSIPSNIAEGRTRHSANDFIYHLNVARGSLAELETQIILSNRLGFLDEIQTQNVLNLAMEIRRMAYALRDSLQSPQDAHAKLMAET